MCRSNFSGGNRGKKKQLERVRSTLTTSVRPDQLTTQTSLLAQKNELVDTTQLTTQLKLITRQKQDFKDIHWSLSSSSNLQQTKDHD